MSLPGYLEIPLRLLCLMGGLLLPGTMILRALRLPWSLACAFATSSVGLYAMVVTYAWTGVAISAISLGVGLATVTLLAWLLPRRANDTRIPSSFACFATMGAWLPLYGAFWLIVVWRLGMYPLNGPDITFRWSWLAEQMLSFKSLDFYPPRTGEDFVRYFWAESIPPGVASVYAWAYACGGSTHALWTSPVVALQLLSVHELIWRVGSRWGGVMVARRAVLLAAACPLLTWSIILGQETGLTALAVMGMVWSLHHLRDDEGNRWAVLTGLFASLGTSTREYGPVFALAALLAAVWLKASRRQIGMIVLVAVPLCLAWPLRVWALTGNPVFSLNVGGIFPTNGVFNSWNDLFRESSRSVLLAREGWIAVARYFFLWALPATIGLVALGVMLSQKMREARVVAWFIGIVFALWFASVAYTAGGLFYSLRVLSPVFALGAVVAGYGLTTWIPAGVASRGTAAVIALMLLESLPKTLVLPENPYRVPPRKWLGAAGEFPSVVRSVNEALVDAVRQLPHTRRVLSDHAGLPRELRPLGIDVAPLWSPEVAWLFDESLPPAQVALQWKESGFRYVVVGRNGPTAKFMTAYARWRAPYFQIRVAAETPTHLVLESLVVDHPVPPE